MAARLILLRHGQIEANRLGLWHGSTDSPLLPEGRRQARRTGRHLARTESALAAIYTSPLTRCVDTASFVAEAYALASLPWWHRLLQPISQRWSSSSDRDRGGPPQPLQPRPFHDLREYGIGEWEGLAFAELARSHRFIERAAADLDFAPANGESLAAVSRRIGAALRAIDAAHGDDEPVLVVAHGAVLAVALATLLNDDPRKWMDYHFDNCSLTVLDLKSPADLVRFNATTHL